MNSQIEAYYYEEREDTWFVELRGTRRLYDITEYDPENPLGGKIYQAIKASLPIYRRTCHCYNECKDGIN
jgi:hypothetical protein